MENLNIKKPDGKLGVLIVGLGGAVSTTFVAGLLNIVDGYGKPICSFTQMGTITIGERSENNFPFIKDVIQLTDPHKIVIVG